MPSSTTADQLDRVIPQLDRLIADVRLGIPSQRAFDDLEERAQAIGGAIVAAFRQPAPPVRKPLRLEMSLGGRAKAVW